MGWAAKLLFTLGFPTGRGAIYAVIGVLIALVLGAGVLKYRKDISDAYDRGHLAGTNECRAQVQEANEEARDLQEQLNEKDRQAAIQRNLDRKNLEDELEIELKKAEQENEANAENQEYVPRFDGDRFVCVRNDSAGGADTN